MNIEELLTELNIPYRTAGQHEHARPGWVQVDCCSCGAEGHYRLGINLFGKYSCCWSCGPIRLGWALSELANTHAGSSRTRQDVFRLLDGLTTIEGVRKRPGSILRIPEGVGNLSKFHRTYLEHRGFDPDQLISQWGIKGIGLAGRLAWTVFIPIQFDGRDVSYACRRLVDEEPRYLNCPVEDTVFEKRQLLYGEDHAGHTVIVVEGFLDVWALGYGAVATMGVGFSRSQARRLSKYPNRVICFDAESEAQKRARDLASKLESFPGRTAVVELATGKDASRCSKWELKKLRGMLR